ncbi:separin [Aspergillus sclerotioniger CBS 115572]|uniref:separase n=1 Tax=Aspergillus sclerotioniger CBS 115572 TaxID=1450535 RepID=A0A317XDT7_9EURO|nr:separin [Aspergillus sclerotioniger CBS 115572]PWY96341.1 separin [Aspergillus sclerotioniger CBS 115572]
MTVSTLLPGSPVESVKQAVRSTSTCSHGTVLSLQTLFRGSSKSPLDGESATVKRVGRTAKASSTAASRTRATRGTRTTVSAAEATLNTVIEQDAARLSNQEKLVLATEVFNSTLKTLSEAMKLHSAKRGDIRTSSASTPRESPSPTRVAKSPRKSKMSLQNTTTTDNGILAVAECAAMSLSCLRTLKGDQEKGVPNMQLEQGACILAGRYLSLGLGDMAYKELRALKKRIQQYLDSQATGGKKVASRKGSPVEQDGESTKERISDLLTFSHISLATPLHGLLVSYQSNALRLISSEKKPATVHNVASSLQLSDPSSPANVTLAALESGALTKDKAAIQLQLLSNTVLSLSSNSQQTATNKIKPTTSLSLQLLSLEIRCMSWKISGHICDDAKEMWDPLARYVASYAHQSKGITRSEFASIYKTIVRLQSVFTGVQKRSSTTMNDNISVARIATILGQLAQEAGCFDEALQLFTESLGPLSNGQCLALATVRCKIASLHLLALKQATKYSSGLANAMKEATNVLCMPLKGSANDLDELLVEAAKLKKLAMGLFGDIVSKEKSLKEEDVPYRIYGYLNGFVRFLRRYLGRKPVEDEGKESESFQKRVTATRNIALAAIDSVNAIGRLSILSQRPPWEEMQSTLIDSQRLLMTMESAEEPSDPSNSESIGLGFVKLSNLFWSRYIKERECGKGYRELVPLLKQAAVLLSNCSPSQKIAGFTPLKYEKLAHLYLEANLAREAEQAFQQSIQEHLLTGTLDQVLSSTDGCFPHRMSQDPKSSGFMLGRVLYAFLKMNLRIKSIKTGVYDDDNLSVLQRGHLLEWQLGIMTELASQASIDNSFRCTFGLLLTKLLDLYSPQAFPIRRLRAVLTILRFSLEYPNSLDSSLLQDVIQAGLSNVDVEELGYDSELSPLVGHLQNSVRLTLGLHEGSLQPKDLEHVLTWWSLMMRECHDWETIIANVGDVDHFLLQMKAVVDYTEIHGLWKLQLSTLELVLRATELRGSSDFSETIIVLSRLAVQYSRLGYCAKAGDLLSRADQYINHAEISCLAMLSHKLARVGYLLETGDVQKAASTLSTARSLYEKNQKKEDLNACSVLSKLMWERLVADAAFMNSRLSFAQGSIKDALFFGKLSVRLNCRIWAKIEKLAQRKQDKISQSGENSELETVVEGMAKLEVSQANATISVYSQGAPFWPHIGSHHMALLNLASLSAHHGLFQDAIYYGEQALKINKTLNANVRLIASQAQLGSHWIFGGHITEGQELLTAAESLSKQLDNSIELVSLQIGLASLHRAQGHYHDEQQALLEADRIMIECAASETSDILSGVADLNDKLKKLQVQGTARKTRQRAPTTTRRTRAATTSSAPKVSGESSESTETGSMSILHLRSDILRQQAACLRSLRDFEQASCLLSDARKFATSRDSQISLHIGESEHLLADAIRNFASHAVYCVLPESTISLPSLQSPSKTATQVSSSKTASTRRTRAPTKTPTRSTRSKTPKPTEDFSVMLSRASESLKTVFPLATTLGSTLDSHAASRLMSRISMLTHVTALECPGSLSQSPANVNEIGRIGAFTREHAAIALDKQLADYCDPLLWPSAETAVVPEDDLCSRFTEEYVEILPENWNVLSLSLSADRTEFVVSRLQKGRSPFLLRLPLKRGNSEDEDEQYTFEDGRDDIQELIRLANESAHAAKHQTDRQMKKDWWKNREALDHRMEALLQHIENVWFGGFRGIFSPVPHETRSLARFADSFHNILDKHLPSRRKGSRAGSPRLTLHPNVLELFIGVKDLDAQDDPEETLVDLLYFVVDILQFQGERNAYDEIDFDMMVVETLDALRGHHDRVRKEQGNPSPNHTVLVLDKSLHMFPWESLPCLQGFPVCRVPSLECLRDRIQRFRDEGADNGVGFRVDRKNGTYILNPTGDLQTTQGTFEKDLVKLKWSGVVNREPTEEEFKNGLESKDLFLYFGHGSGAQYCRARTIKRLDRCAITFLMGCSSGALTEAGEYEPYGTPLNYLHAGSPALVATLWDVTDKDIDRFAKSTLEKWGLVGSLEGAVALDDAVCQSRQACVLKYLNGAAPVIYGIPAVFLA